MLIPEKPTPFGLEPGINENPDSCGDQQDKPIVVPNSDTAAYQYPSGDRKATPRPCIDLLEYRDHLGYQEYDGEDGKSDEKKGVCDGCLHLPPKVCGPLQITGQLSKVANFYEQQIEASITTVTSLIEPILVIFIGTVVGGILLSIFLPIFKMGRAIH